MLFQLNDSIAFTAEAARVSRTVLPSGVRILTEEVLGAPSVSIAASVAVGSRDESGVHFGSTHFLEHLLFKGTPKRGQKDISIAKGAYLPSLTGFYGFNTRASNSEVIDFTTRTITSGNGIPLASVTLPEIS